MKALAICVLIIVFLVIIFRPTSEGFATRREKAQTIFDWFKTQSTPTYTLYKESVKGSNVVEYEDVLKLFKQKDLTVDKIERVV